MSSCCPTVLVAVVKLDIKFNYPYRWLKNEPTPVYTPYLRPR
jgi:hypothetical protein